MSIKRFGYGLQDDDLRESPVGPYVHWEDYQQLLRDCEAGFMEGAYARLSNLQRIERAASEYVREQLADDPRIADEGCALHELAKALGFVK